MSYQPPVTHPVYWGIDTVNNPALTSDGVGVYLSILQGWDDTAEIRDTREVRPGLDGELARNLLLSGRTVTLEGFVQGNSWADLQTRKNDLRRMFVPSATELTFKVPDPTYEGQLGSAAASFDGVNDYATVAYNADVNPSTSFSIEFWFNPTNGTASQRLVGSLNSGSTKGYSVRIATNLIFFGVSDGAAFSEGSTTPTTVVDGTWNHVVCTFDGTNRRIYLNGRREAGPTADAYTPNITDALMIAASLTPGSFFGGSMKDVSVYNTALSQDRVLAHYVAGIDAAGDYYDEVAQDTPVAWWRMADVAGGTLMSDETGNSHNGTYVNGVTLTASPTALAATYGDALTGYFRVSARVVEPIAFGESMGGFAQRFQVSIRASDPRRYSDVASSSQTTDLPTGGGFTSPIESPIDAGDAVTGGSVTVVNNGDYETPMLLRIYGPVTNPVVEDLAERWKIAFNGIAVASGDFIEVDVVDRTAYLNGREDLPGNNLLRYVDQTQTTWGLLAAGSTTIRYSGVGIANPAYLYVEYRDAYA